MNAEYINSLEPIYSYLLSYFLPDLSDPYFRQDAAQEIEQDERMTYCRYSLRQSVKRCSVVFQFL